MAREKTYLRPALLWENEAFTTLSPEAQRVYFLLIAGPDSNTAGIAPLRLHRWSTWTAGATADELGHALAELARASFAVVDHEAEEVYVRGLYRHERVGGQPRRVAAIFDAIATSDSETIRAAALTDLEAEVAAAEAAAPAGMRARILGRDGEQCVTCGWRPGDPVPTAPSGRPIHRGLELDHIHPRSKGGPDEEGNFHVLCSSCNASKGATGLMRIRTIKPEFWTSEDIAALDWDARLIFIGLWSYVDDNGVGRDVEKLILADLFPLEDDPRETLARLCARVTALWRAGRSSDTRSTASDTSTSTPGTTRRSTTQARAAATRAPPARTHVIRPDRRPTLGRVSRDRRACTGVQGYRGTGEFRYAGRACGQPASRHRR
jgi:5-methylcytosine-specific restriction endonuclease McrA